MFYLSKYKNMHQWSEELNETMLKIPIFVTINNKINLKNK